MMAPIFKKVAAQYKDSAVFVKIDTNAQYELASRYQIRSLPTFAWFVNHQKVHQVSGGIGEGPLQQETQKFIRQAQAENVQVTRESLTTFYSTVDATKTMNEIQAVYQKCVDMNKKRIKNNTNTQCVGTAANQLVRRLKKKYQTGPVTTLRFFAPTTEKKKATDSSDDDDYGGKKKTTTTEKKDGKGRRGTTGSSSSSSSRKDDQPNLHLASKEELLAELERRLDAERDEQVEAEDEGEDETDPDFSHAAYIKSDFPERLVIVGGGPAGLAAAIYGARAGLQPLVLAPILGGGQLQAKGVDVENYPGVSNVTGPALVAYMRRQAAHFGAVFEDDVVIKVTVASGANGAGAGAGGGGPIQITTNNTGVIATHTLVICTGAESNWLNVTGEYELRGGGVSSCATCDGFLYTGRHVVVVGGGDTAMEDALVLARTSQHVTIVHRRDSFRASKVLQDRVLQHPSISVEWNTTIKEILGTEITPDEYNSSSSSTTNNRDEQCDDDDDDDDDDEAFSSSTTSTTTLDLDNMQKVVSGVVLQDTATGQERRLACQAVFVAIGHTPTTQFLQNSVGLDLAFNPQHPGYIQTFHGSTHTSVPGIFAAGDVVDPVYRQAVTSAGSGAAAALDAERYLSQHGLGNEAAEFEAELLRELLHDGNGSNGSGNADDASSYYNAYDEAGGRFHGAKESLAV
jgi:thioredoxin reductase (NADPH)